MGSEGTFELFEVSVRSKCLYLDHQTCLEEDKNKALFNFEGIQ